MSTVACGGRGKGKGKWREANGRRQLPTVIHPAIMPNPPLKRVVINAGCGKAWAACGRCGSGPPLPCGVCLCVRLPAGERRVVPSRLKEYDGWYLRVYARVRLLRRGSPTCGWGGWLHTRWVGGDEGEFLNICRRLVRVGQLFLAYKCCFCPLAPLPRRHQQCSTQSLFQDWAPRTRK